MDQGDKYILIAGGTGLLGTEITRQFRQEGRRVKILTRGATDADEGLYHWNPAKLEIDALALEDVIAIINLTGVGIADKRWTKKRKAELIESRVQPTTFLYQLAPRMPELQHYITASGINCYGFDEPDRLHPETDPFGEDFLSQVVKRWETAADQFQTVCRVTKVRTPTVLSDQGGALPVMAKPVKLGVGSPLGKGNQGMPWVHIEDIALIYKWLLDEELEGAFNANADNVTNREFMETLAKALNRPFWAPRVPAGLLKVMLGKMSSLVLQGLMADNSKLRNTGFTFKYEHLDEALESIYCC